MSPHDGYDRSSRRNRGAAGHWVPLILTVAVATIGFATWVWSERSDDDEEDGGYRRRRDDYGDSQVPPTYGDARSGDQSYGTTARHTDEPSSYVARVSGALRRTPSPQQFLEGATRTVSAGITAAGAAVGNALSSIREEDKNAYKDHKTWSEEAEARRSGDIPKVSPVQSKRDATSGKGASSQEKKIKVAVVVSADADLDGVDDGLDYSQTHASVLSFLPHNTDFSKIQLYVLIFSPDLKHHPLDISGSKPIGSLSSSFSNIDPDQALTPAEEGEKAMLDTLSPHTPAFNALWNEAELVVEKNTMIFPFTTQGGHVHILRHLSPDVVYLQEALSGKEGDVITHLQTWLRGDVVVVVGGDHGDGGLADSESEAEQAAPKQKVEKWWEKEERVGKGRHVFVVENLRVGDDWTRRIEGKD